MAFSISTGFSRRITHKIRLTSFSLKETREYLLFKGFDLSLMSVADVYMILGGIPYYLNFMSPHKSIYQNIEDECFDINGRLVNEYDIIFISLFKSSETYKKVVEFIASKQKGVLLKELTDKFPSLKGGNLARILYNLVSSNFMKKKEDLRRYFATKKKNQKDIHMCYVTPNGLYPNKYFNQLQPSVVKLEDLFQNDSASPVCEFSRS